MRRSIEFIATVAVIAVIASCGSGDTGGGGGSEVFSTVDIFASYDGNPYTADAQTLEDTTGDGFCDTSFVTADDITATVTSMAFDPLPVGVDPCNVNISRYTLRYYPHTSASAPIPSNTIHQSINIPPPAGAGGTLSTEIVLRLFDLDQKATLNPLLFASGETEFQYDVKISLKMREVCTNIDEEVEFWVPVRYFDAATDTCN